MQSFGDLCLDAYFSEDASLFDRVSVNAGLYSLFWDYASTTQMSPEEKERNLAYARLCRDNLETGLADMPLHLPASANVVAALLFGACPTCRDWEFGLTADNDPDILCHRVLDFFSLLVPLLEGI
jgi:hypothetical protein